MSEFINSIDLLGEEAVTDSLIDRSIVEYNDNSVTSIGEYAFAYCAQLTSVDLPAITSIAQYAFSNCSKLTALILRKNAVCTLNTNVFTSTPIASGTGYIYVPATLVGTYKTTKNWSTFANQFRALEDYTVDGTITGELDPTKI